MSFVFAEPSLEFLVRVEGVGPSRPWSAELRPLGGLAPARVFDSPFELVRYLQGVLPPAVPEAARLRCATRPVVLCPNAGVGRRRQIVTIPLAVRSIAAIRVSRS